MGNDDHRRGGGPPDADGSDAFDDERRDDERRDDERAAAWAGRHLDWTTLERALAGEVTPVEVVRDLLQHLLALCPACRRTWRRAALPRGGEGEAADRREGAYSGAFGRALALLRAREPDLAAERRQAPERVRRLLALPEAEQLDRLRHDPRLATWGVCDLLLNEAYEATFEEPAAGEGLARLALLVAERLEPGRYGRRFLADVRALAWAYLGNARRVASDLRGAGESLAEAGRLLAEGVGEPLTRAQVLNLAASLYRDQRRFAESQQLLAEVAALYRQVGDRHLEGRIRVKEADVLQEMGRAAESIDYLQQAVELIDAAREPRLDLCARHNLVSSLVDAGRFAEAEARLEEILPLYERFADAPTRLRWRWVEGRLAAGRGRSGAAEAAFREVRLGFIEREIGYDAALASLDLAALYARDGRGDRVRALAEEMLPIFRSRDVHREAMAALLVFQQAARAERVTEEMVRRIAAYLRRARRDPTYRYEEPS